MFGALKKLFSSMDELERLADGNDPAALIRFLKARPVLVVRKPRKLLDPAGLTPDQLVAELEKDANELANADFEPWVLESDGPRRLLIFSSMQKLEMFAGALSKSMNKMFSAGAAEVLVPELVERTGVNLLELNAFCGQSWQLKWEERA